LSDEVKLNRKNNMKKKMKTLWEATDVKTGRQITLWILTITIAILFGNNIAIVLDNLFKSPVFSPLFYLISLFLIRVILGYLFD